MFERPQGGEKALLVQLALPGLDSERALEEFAELARSAQAEVVGQLLGSRSSPEAKYFIGSGKAEALKAMVDATEAELVLVNHELSAPQERNLERLLCCRVVSRSGLILDIFAQRARTFEGKLQVELAQLQHISTRLIRGWTHLERQKGGIGLRGPGETQLETDRRLLRDRIKAIHQRLKKVRRSREQNRRARQKAAMATVSLVGYTNAGKSTLFNALVDDSIFAADQLFATLDPTMRKLSIPGTTPVVLADTVGFIRDLPHQLIEAFSATLEETEQSQLLLHVIDVSDPSWRDHVASVDRVLLELGIEEVPIIQVFNKIDRLEDCEAKVHADEAGCKVWVSAKTGVGLEELKAAIAKILYGNQIETRLLLRPEEGKLRAKLYALDAVIQEQVDEHGYWTLVIRMSQRQYQQLFVDDSD